MDSKKVITLLLLLAGEVLIIICFLFFGKNLDTNILALNIVVTTIIFALYSIDLLFPLVDFKDKSQRTVGSLGIRWIVTIIYTVFAIGLMIILNAVKPVDFNIQILFHSILFFLLLLGLFSAFSAANKVNEVYIEEKKFRNHVDEMKKATKEVQLKLNLMKEIPAEIKNRATALQENLRFISPCNNQEANDLESNYLNEIKAVHDSLFDMPLDYDKITENIQKCETTYQERKQIFSN